ncbi:MAG: ABC transporter ATP-binding protein [Myxococcaceae bacterium]
MATVSLEGVSKEFRKGTFALRTLNLSIADGEFVCLVGPSGCGKSTTLNLIAGLESPSTGRIRIGERDVTDLEPGARDIAMVFQSYALYPHLNVERNIAFPLRVAKLPAAEIAARVRETAELLGLSQLLTRMPRELSGGQRQRVALGRALVRRPRAFLFDEPLSNLDAALRAELRAEIKKLHERLHATFIYVTHDQAEAMTLSDRVVLMKQGAIEQEGPPEELYRNPRTLFAARFFGAPRINVVPPEVLGLSRQGALAAIRPEHVSLSSNGIAGRVYLVESFGADTWVTVEVGSEKLVARGDPEQRLTTGQSVNLAFDPAKILWFDASTEERQRGG